jgi:hypothetical protein
MTSRHATAVVADRGGRQREETERRSSIGHPLDARRGFPGLGRSEGALATGEVGRADDHAERRHAVFPGCAAESPILPIGTAVPRNPVEFLLPASGTLVARTHENSPLRPRIAVRRSLAASMR